MECQTAAKLSVSGTWESGLECWCQAGFGGSAEGGEIEVDGDGVAFGGNDLDIDGIGGEGTGGELQIEGSTDRTAGAGTPAAGKWAAYRIGGRKELVAAKHLDAKVSPEIMWARDERRGRAGTRGCWIGDQSAIGIG